MKSILSLLPSSSIHVQRGSTLIEVLVSMFILALGIMALISMQVRTSAGIKEAEYRSVVAQATQSLAEGMLANPSLRLVPAASGAVDATIKNYDAYNIADCENITAAASATAVTKEQLAQAQQAAFCNAITSIPGMQEPTVSITTSGADTLINVTWKMDTTNEDSTAANIEDNKITYSYQLPLGH